MMDRDTAGVKVFPGSLAALRPVWEAVDCQLAQRKLSRDVKTIYVSYTDGDGNIVAAVHPDPKTGTIEAALSIPADTDNPHLYDAVHLKWRTLPVAVHLGNIADVSLEFEEMIDTACESASLVAPRPTDDFMRQRRRGRFSDLDPN